MKNIQKLIEHGYSYYLVVNNVDNHILVWVDFPNNSKAVFELTYDGDYPFSERVNITNEIISATGNNNIHVIGLNAPNFPAVGTNPWHFKFHVEQVDPNQQTTILVSRDVSGQDLNVHPSELVVYTDTIPF